jgi:hypothetical protein
VLIEIGFFFLVMVFNATFNNISVISWWSVLLLEETDKLFHMISKFSLFSEEIHVFICNVSISICHPGRMVVRFTYHHKNYEYESRSWRGVLDTTLCEKVCQFPQAIKLTTTI